MTSQQPPLVSQPAAPAPLTPSDLDPVARRRMWLRALAASTIGTTIEWYDFFLYGIVAALVFPRLFFPESDPFTGTLLAFSTYFVGFAARPVGGIVFGHVGDRLGCKASLVATMLLMGAATVGIGLVPGYDTIGTGAACCWWSAARCRGSASAASGAGRFYSPESGRIPTGAASP